MKKRQEKRPIKHRKRYKLNWLQIVQKLEQSEIIIDRMNGIVPDPLRDAIDALRERLGMPARDRSTP